MFAILYYKNEIIINLRTKQQNVTSDRDINVTEQQAKTKSTREQEVRRTSTYSTNYPLLEKASSLLSGANPNFG
jgi:hypothetical protein